MSITKYEEKEKKRRKIFQGEKTTVSIVRFVKQEAI